MALKLVITNQVVVKTYISYAVSIRRSKDILVYLRIVKVLYLSEMFIIPLIPLMLVEVGLCSVFIACALADGVSNDQLELSGDEY